MPRFNTREEMIAWAKEQQRLRKLQDKERERQRWENLGTLTKPADVPEIKVCDTWEEYNYYVNKLYAAGALPKDKLVDGAYYLGAFRCTTVAKWDATREMFDYKYYGHGEGVDEAHHFADDKRWAAFVPIRMLNIDEVEERFKL